MKYQLICKNCGKVTKDFAAWFKQDQLCECGSNYAEVVYFSDYKKISDLCNSKHRADNFYHYFDFLPLNSKDNIVSLNEGAVPMERWGFLEKYALEQHGVKCQVVVCRNDLNQGSNTFKDLAASLAASLFKENGVKEYCLASTGNTATAYSVYLAKIGVKFNIFTPSDMYQDSVDAIKATGQNLIVCKGNYAFAKKEATEYHKSKGVMISAGNIDPIRVEAKKTLVFECLRQLGRIPDVYIQAVAGGTSPIAFQKGMNELSNNYPELKMPRMILVQQDTCDPMVQAWEWAEANNFPVGYEKKYPSIEPKTKISILSAGIPAMYPILGPIVKNSGGCFIRVKESDLPYYGKIVKKEQNIYFGPASIICIEGFYQALKENKIKEGDQVLLNAGEGAERSKWFQKEIDEQL